MSRKSWNKRIWVDGEGKGALMNDGSGSAVERQRTETEDRDGGTDGPEGERMNTVEPAGGGGLREECVKEE